MRDPLQEILRHRQNQARRAATAALRDAERVDAVLPDIGHIAIVDEADGVVVPAGQFDLDNQSLVFQPGGTNASQYSYSLLATRFDAEAMVAGVRVQLADDAAIQIALPFSFPYFGRRHSAAFLHSDGNLTFVASDPESTERTVARLVSGPPRIGPLFSDLDPSQQGAEISYVSTAARFLVTWSNVPFYSPTPAGVPRQTLQLAIFPDGRIEFSYRGIRMLDSLVVGLAPGGALATEVTMVDFSAASSTPHSRAVVEEFTSQARFDLVALTKKYYRNHDDFADYLIIFDNADRHVDACAFAFPIRNEVHGIGLTWRGLTEEFDFARDLGSAGRIQTLIYMGPLSQYPADPAEIMPRRSICGPNSTLTVMGQEAGHRFLAFPLFVDPATNRLSGDLLGRDQEHWSFYFNSDGSLVEGNRIEDKGAGVTPRFESKEIIQHYGAWDQYFMGLRGPDDVPPSFLVRNSSIAGPGFTPTTFPQAGLFFDGTRVDITLPMVVAAEGRRLPDHTVSQKVFRFAFIFLAPSGSAPPAADVAKIDRLRTAWETFFRRATADRATPDTRLVKQLRLSVWPAAGLVQGRTITASISLAAPAAAPVAISLTASSGAITVPGAVTIAAGRQTVEFPIAANSAGLVELAVQGPDASYEAPRAFLRVRPNTAGLRVEQLWELALAFGLTLRPPTIPDSALYAGGTGVPLREELIYRVRDEDFLPYPGLRVAASPSGAGSVAGSNLTTDARGWVRVRWSLDTNPGLNTLNVALDGQPDASAQTEATGVLQPNRRRDPRPSPDPVP